MRDDTALVRFSFLAKVDVRTFRDDSGYVVDVVGADTKPDEQSAAPAGHRSAAKRGAGNHRAGNGPAGGAERRRARPRPGGSAGDAGKTRLAPPAAASRRRREPSGAAASRRPTNRRQRRKRKRKSPRRNAAAAGAVSRPAKAAPPRQPAAATRAAAAPQAPANAAPPLAPRAANTEGNVAVELTRQGDNLKLSFPFATPTPAAVFHRADTLWLVFDSNADIDLGALDGEASNTIRSAEVTRAPDADIVRIKLDRPRLASVDVDGAGWTVQIGDAGARADARARPSPATSSAPTASASPFRSTSRTRCTGSTDPDVGDTLLVVTAFGPARGFVNEQDFVEFRALASTQGIVVEPLADDLKVELSADKVVVGRPGGLDAVDVAADALRGAGLRPAMFDSQLWGFDREAEYHRAAVASWSPRPRRRRTTSAWRRGSISRASISRATCIRRPRPCSTSRSPTSRPAAEQTPASCCARSPTSCWTAPKRR